MPRESVVNSVSTVLRDVATPVDQLNPPSVDELREMLDTWAVPMMFPRLNSSVSIEMKIMWAFPSLSNATTGSPRMIRAPASEASILLIIGEVLDE